MSKHTKIALCHPPFYNRNGFRFLRTAKFIIMLGITTFTFFSFSKDVATDKDELIDEYINSFSNNSCFAFDAANIKQFWINTSVASKNGSICISLNNKDNTSDMLKVQLANVTKAMDCKVLVIADSPDYDFTVLNSNNKVVSSSNQKDNFIQYLVVSNSVHLTNLNNNVLFLQFSSKTDTSLTIKKIVFFFSQSTLVLRSPNTVKLSENDFKGTKPHPENEGYSLDLKRYSQFLPSKYMEVSDNTFTSTLRAKNTGNAAVAVYVGYALYSKDLVQLSPCNYPHSTSDAVLRIVSAEKDSKSIIVDSSPKWAKNCTLALHAEEDLSDIPNITLADGAIVDVVQLADGKYEIKMSEPQSIALKEGIKIRVHGPRSHSKLLYTEIKRLQPGEEYLFSYTIKKDEENFEFSKKAFPKGTSYAKPTLVFEEKDTSVLLSDYSVSY